MSAAPESNGATKRDDKDAGDKAKEPRKRSRSRSRRRSRSRSRRRSRERAGRRRHSRSRSRTPPRRRSSRSRSRSRSRSPRRSFAARRGFGRGGVRENPEPCKVLGVFGLSQHTSKSTVDEEFSKFGKLERVDMIMDRQTGRSKGFGFVYYTSQNEATEARDAMNGKNIDGRKIRVDYSVTLKAHEPTPGRYFGQGGNRSPRRRGSRSRSRSRSRGRQ